MTNPMPSDNPKFDEVETGRGPSVQELYDDLPPAEQSKPSSFGTLLATALLRELNATLQDVNKIVAFFEEVERTTTPRTTVSGEVIQSSLTEGIIQVLKRTGLNESLREQLIRLQSSTFRNNLETALRQYWNDLRQAGSQLQAKVKQQVQAVRPSQTEQYTPEPEAAPGPPSANQPTYSPTKIEVAQAPDPMRELVVDLFDEATSGEIVLVSEHPGLLASSIRVNLAHDIVNLSASDLNEQFYSKEVLLPAPVEPNAFAQTYRNGVLEIRFKRQ